MFTKSKIVKKISVFAVIAVAATIAVAAFSTPAARATYTEKTPVNAPAKVEEAISLDNVAPSSTIADVEEVKGTQIKEASSEETYSEVKGSVIQEAAKEEKEATANNNDTSRSTSNPQSETNNTRQNNQTRQSSQSSQNKSSQGKSTRQSNQANKSKSSSGNTGNGFTTEKEKKTSASSSPVKLSQAAPYYYNNVLTSAEKNLYNMMLDGFNNVSRQIALGSNLNKNQIDNAFNAVIRDQSQIFWLGLSYTIRTVTTHEGGRAVTNFTFEPSYTMSANQVAAAKSKLDNAVNKILATLNGDMSQYDLELAVHDYIVRKANYSNRAVKNPNNYPMAFTAYGALVDGSAVCEGYAKAFQLVLNKVGIQTTLVSGKNSGTSHMWNMAKIDGAWYHVDLTFDDPNNGNSKAVLRNYFNLSASEITRTRSINNRFAIPSAKSSKSNYFNTEGLSFGSYNSSAANKLYNEVVRAIKNKNTTVQIRVGGSMNSAVSVLTNAKATNGLNNIKTSAQKATGTKLSRFSYSTDASLGIITIYLSF